MDNINEFFKNEDNLLNVRSLLNLLFSIAILSIAYGFLKGFEMDELLSFNFGVVSVALIYTGISNKNDATYRGFKNACDDKIIKTLTDNVNAESDKLEDITVVEDYLKVYNERQIELIKTKYSSYDTRKLTRVLSKTNNEKKIKKYKNKLSLLETYGSTRKIKYRDITASDIISFSKLNFKTEKDILNDNVLKRRKKKNSLTTTIWNLFVAASGFLAFASETNIIKTIIFVTICIIIMAANYLLEYIFSTADTRENHVLTLRTKLSILRKVSTYYNDIKNVITNNVPPIKNDLLIIKEPN